MEPLQSTNWQGPLLLAQAGPRCGARNRAGLSCQSPAMPNGRCRMHGGPSTGPRTAEGLARLRAARTRTGMHTAEMRDLRAAITALQRETRAMRDRT